MAYVDHLAFEGQRCAEIERKARERDLVFRREMIRAEHRARHERDMSEYRAGPVARRMRFARLRAMVRHLGPSFRAGRAAGRARVMEAFREDARIRAERPALGQRVRGRMRALGQRLFSGGRSRGGNMERERSRARERAQELAQQRRQRTRQREQQQTARSRPAGDYSDRALDVPIPAEMRVRLEAVLGPLRFRGDPTQRRIIAQRSGTKAAATCQFRVIWFSDN